jgi:hypothetical protein
MQTNIIFSIIVSIIYFIATLTLNRFIEDKKTLKVIAQDSCLVFLSVLVGSYSIDFLGLASIAVKQTGGNTVAFITKPEF